MGKQKCLYICVMLCAIGVINAAHPAAAQSYPQKPIRLVVGVPPGGTTDIVARLVGQKIDQKWGKVIKAAGIKVE